MPQFSQKLIFVIGANFLQILGLDAASRDFIAMHI